MAGAAALSLGMVGTFSIPAYASSPAPEGLPDGFVATQTLQTNDAVPAAFVVAEAPASEAGAVAAEAAQAEADKKDAEAKAKTEAAAKSNAGGAGASTEAPTGAPSGNDIPAGSGGAGIANAALAQLGVNQDCTALVENSLRAVGIPAGDLGTQVYEYTALGGTVVSSGDYAPGDILVFPGQHVGVYIGNGQAVHGGWGGTTRVGPIAPGGETGLTVVRFG